MRSFAWTWIAALSLLGGWAPAPDCGSLLEVEEQEDLRHPEREVRIRKKTVAAPVVVTTPPTPSSHPARFLPPVAAPSLALWIARTHQRSPTA